MSPAIGRGQDPSLWNLRLLRVSSHWGTPLAQDVDLFYPLLFETPLVEISTVQIKVE